MIFRSKSHEETRSQTALLQDTTAELETERQTAPALLKETVELNNKTVGEKIDIAHTLLARDYKGFANQQYGNGVVEWKEKS